MEITGSLIISYIIIVFTGLFPIANPLSTAPVFLVLTKNYSDLEKNDVALKASIYMLIVLISFLLLGALILGFFGITITGLRIAGGLIILVTGLKMLFAPTEQSSQLDKKSVKHQNIAFSPLAMPMLSGPGSISVVLSMSDKIADLETYSLMITGYLVVAVGILITVVACWFVLRYSNKVTRFMGETGIDAMTRFMAFFLVAIGVDFLLGGVSAYLEGIKVIG